jgi:hypothetical protein
MRRQSEDLTTTRWISGIEEPSWRNSPQRTNLVFTGLNEAEWPSSSCAGSNWPERRCRSNEPCADTRPGYSPMGRVIGYADRWGVAFGDTIGQQS